MPPQSDRAVSQSTPPKSTLEGTTTQRTRAENSSRKTWLAGTILFLGVIAFLLGQADWKGSPRYLAKIFRGGNEMQGKRNVGYFVSAT
jgi:hypothetical protein